MRRRDSVSSDAGTELFSVHSLTCLLDQLIQMAMFACENHEREKGKNFSF